MVNDHWLSKFDSAECYFQLPGSSDHSPGIIRIDDNSRPIFSSFKYCNFWARDEKFRQILCSCWMENVQGTPMFCFVKKLKAVKKELRVLHKTEYGKMQSRINTLKHELDNVQRSLQVDNGNHELWVKEKEVRAQYCKLVAAELQMLKQKTKDDWLKGMDANTSYFHASLKDRAARNRIISICTVENVRIIQEAEIAAEFIQTFKSLFGTADQNLQEIDYAVLNRGPKLSDSQKQELSNPVTENEIYTAICSIDSGKAPGPDGFSSGFYKSAWDVIKVDLCTAVQDFFLKGKMLQQVNCTLISLIPKVSSPTFATDYRPISCCNVVYKVITKIMANRMQSMLGDIISYNQGAFVKNRSIMDNILICQDIVHNYHRNEMPGRCLFKLDLQKAYDTIDWRFLRDVMLGLGFPDHFVSLVTTCLNTAMFSINVNGKPEGFFPGMRGLRQGDPLSPYLFVIAMEYFSRLLLALDQDSDFKYHTKCKKLKLTHLSYADDLMLMCKGDKTSALKLKGVFDIFSKVSGLKANMSKSSIYFCGVDEGTIRVLQSQLEIPIGTLPVRYLGVPLISNRLTLRDCQPLLERIRNKLSCWTTKHLSYAGRAQLLKSVIMHMQVYWSLAFLLPKSAIKEIGSLCNRFLWSGKIDQRAMTMVAWKSVCLPRGEGGLGLRQIDNWNRAAMCKYIWRICANENSTWVKWCKEQLLQGKSIWQITTPTDAAWTWRNILGMRSCVKEHIQVQLGDGRQTSLFYDNWLPGGSIVSMIQNSEMIGRWGHGVTVADWRSNGQWVIPKSFDRCHPGIANEMKKHIMQQENDRAIWKLSARGNFSIADCYEALRRRAEKVPWRNLVWQKSVLPRHSFCLWMAMRRKLKTKAEVANKGIPNDGLCVLCRSHEENCEHLFFECSFSNDVWRLVLRDMGIHRTPLRWTMEQRWLRSKNRGRGTTAKTIAKACAAVIYEIWRERNRRLFMNEVRGQHCIVANITNFVRRF